MRVYALITLALLWFSTLGNLLTVDRENCPSALKLGVNMQSLGMPGKRELNFKASGLYKVFYETSDKSFTLPRAYSSDRKTCLTAERAAESFRGVGKNLKLEWKAAATNDLLALKEPASSRHDDLVHLNGTVRVYLGTIQIAEAGKYIVTSYTTLSDSPAHYLILVERTCSTNES